MTAGKWLIFDTSVYIAAIRGGPASRFVHELQSALPRTYLSAVVSAELRAGALDEAARKAIEHFTRKAHDVGRLITPNLASWQKAGDVLRMIHGKEPHLRAKLPMLWNDLLIALSARELGALVVTMDAADFELLRRYAQYELNVVD